MNAWDPTPVATVAQFEDGLIRMRDNYGIPLPGLKSSKLSQLHLGTR